MQTLVIGDIHGHLDRFELLLMQEGLLDRCHGCDGHGEIYASQGGGWVECGICHGDGWERVRRDEVEVVLVGDIGHFGCDGSPTGDMLTMRAALHWADVRLWGNHDRALVDAGHHFSGFMKPPPEVYHMLAMADMKLAHSAHGFLITHAGLHVAFKDQANVPPEVKSDPKVFADWINFVSDTKAQGTPSQFAVRDAVSRQRGGPSPYGGILWRDINEKLYTPRVDSPHGFRQVFGHSADREHHAVRYCAYNRHSRTPIAQIDEPSYCIDVGGKGVNFGDRCLAGIYLPDERIVRIDLDKKIPDGYPTLT